MFMRGREKKHILSWQLELPVSSSLPNQIPKPMHTAPLIGILLDISVESRSLELRDPEHQGHGLRQPVLFSANLVTGTRPRRHIPITRAVDNDVSANHNRTGFRFKHDSFHTMITDNIACECMEQKAHSRLVQEIQCDQLKYFRVEGHHIARLQGR